MNQLARRPHDFLAEPDGWRWLHAKLAALNRLGQINCLLADGERLYCYHDAAGWKGLDGFSPGSVILTKVPGIQTDAALKKTGAVSLSALSKYTDRRAPVIVWDATSRKRWPIWAELDNNAKAGSRLLEVHPAKNLLEGHRYVVILRSLKRADGGAIHNSPVPA